MDQQIPEREPDYYAVLNLPEGASYDAVQEQYRRLVKVFHPDRNGGDRWCEEQLKHYNAAYAVLSDPDRKSAYDKRRSRRQADALDLAETFEPIIDSEPEPAPSTSWTFTAPGRASSDESMPAGGAATMPGVFAAASVATATIPTHVAAERERRTNKTRYALAAAGLSLLVLMVVIVSSSPDTVFQKPPDPSAKTFDPAAPLPPSTDDIGPKLGPRFAAQVAPISNADDAAADRARHGEAVQLHAQLTPYWQRYQRALPRANDAITRGQRILDRLAPASPSAADSAARTKLASDVRSLRDQVDIIQSQFDDLRYPAADEDVAAEVKQLSTRLAALESNDAPLYSDLQQIAQSQSRHA